jgi:hypothetical protein
MSHFRRNNPDFAPDGWWDYVPTDWGGEPRKQPLWQTLQEDLKVDWEWGLDGTGTAFLERLYSVFDPDKIIFPKVWNRDGGQVEYRPMFPLGGDGSVNLQALENDRMDWWAYQRGLLYLREHPKLARNCKTCHIPIVNRKYCERHAEDAKASYYQSHAAELRAKRNKKYAQKIAAEGRKKTRRGRPRLPVYEKPRKTKTTEIVLPL